MTADMVKVSDNVQFTRTNPHVRLLPVSLHSTMQKFIKRSRTTPLPFCLSLSLIHMIRSYGAQWQQTSQKYLSKPCLYVCNASIFLRMWVGPKY